MGDWARIGLFQSSHSLSMCRSMNSVSHSSSSNVIENCAINVFKFQLGRFQNIVSQKSRDIWAVKADQCANEKGDHKFPLPVKL